MSAIEVLGALASKFLAPLIGTSPDFDRTCRALAIGGRPCLITAAIVNLASTMAPTRALSTQDVGAMGASALFLLWGGSRTKFSEERRRLNSHRL